LSTEVNKISIAYVFILKRGCWEEHLVRYSNLSLISPTALGYTIKTTVRITPDYWGSVKMSLTLILLTWRIWWAP